MSEKLFDYSDPEFEDQPDSAIYKEMAENGVTPALATFDPEGYRQYLLSIGRIDLL